MIPARLRNATRNSAVGIRRLTLAMHAAGLVLNIGASQAAPARDNGIESSLSHAMEERFRAPIGHRQPTAEDLPQGVLRDEGTATQNQRSFDKQLNICRAC
jgi:hypothetical protein